MGYTKVALEDKVLQMYPEIRRHGISVSLGFSEEKDAWAIRFSKGEHRLETYLDRADADECMNDVKCVRLGVKLGEFIDNFEKRA